MEFDFTKEEIEQAAVLILKKDSVLPTDPESLINKKQSIQMLNYALSNGPVSLFVNGIITGLAIAHNRNEQNKDLTFKQKFDIVKKH